MARTGQSKRGAAQRPKLLARIEVQPATGEAVRRQIEAPEIRARRAFGSALAKCFLRLVKRFQQVLKDGFVASVQLNVSQHAGTHFNGALSVCEPGLIDCKCHFIMRLSFRATGPFGVIASSTGVTRSAPATRPRAATMSARFTIGSGVLRRAALDRGQHGLDLVGLAD